MFGDFQPFSIFHVVKILNHLIETAIFLKYKWMFQVAVPGANVTNPPSKIDDFIDLGYIQK